MIKEIILLILIGVYYFSIKKYSSERKSAIAIASGALMLFVDAKDALPLILTVSLIIISEYLIKKDALLNLLKYLGYLFLTLCIGAFPLFSAFIDHSLFDEKYSGFFFRYSLLHEIAFVYGLIVIFFFFRVSLKETILRILLLIFVMALDMTGFFGMVLSLGLYSDGTMVAYDLLLLFYLSKITIEAAVLCYRESKKRLLFLSLVLLSGILSYIMIPHLTSSSDVGHDVAPDEYGSFYLEHTDQSVFGIINTIEKRVKLSDEEKREVLFADEFEVINAKCRKLGYDEPLFIPVKNAEIEFAESDKYIITPYKNGIFNIKYVNEYPEESDPAFNIPFTIKMEDIPESDVYIYDTYTGKILCYAPDQIKEGGTSFINFKPSQYHDVNLRIPVYEINPGVAAGISDVLLEYMVDEVRNVSLVGDAIGIILSIIGIFIFIVLYFYKGRGKLISSIEKGILHFCESDKTYRFFGFIKENRIYFYSFLIPFFVCLILLIIHDCMPFGSNSLFDSDGIELVLPGFWEAANVARAGNRYLSLSGGYGYSIYDPNPFTTLYRMLNVLGNGGIVSFWDLFECVLIGSCGISMTYFMTHQSFFTRVKKNDMRLLVPALAYSLNSYNVAIHMFPTWYVNLIIFPFLLIGFERLMISKKYILYGSLLLISTVMNVQHSMYICIFLVMYFFTYKFTDIRDFFFKGIRFAVVSVLAVLPAAGVIFTVLGSTDDSAYRDTDSVFPAIGFHKNFFDQWKQYLFMSQTKTVTIDNGGLNVFMGILILIMFGVFLLSKKHTIKEKIRLIMPVLFLTVSFNGKVLSFLWNGFHYQSMVPNRYAFLMVFYLSVLAFEGLMTVKDEIKNICIVLSGMVLFIMAVYFLGNDKELRSVLASLILLAIYAVLLSFIHIKKKRAEIITGIMILFFCSEMIVSFFYSAYGIKYGEITMYGNIEEERAAFNVLKERDNDFFRISFPSSDFVCGGMVYDVPSLALFGSYVNKHQLKSADLFGLGSGINWLKDINNSTPVMNSLQGVRYIAIPKVSKDFPKDIDFYDYVGETGSFFIFENKDALSIGEYMPSDLKKISEDSYNIAMLYNGISSSLIGKDIFELGVVGVDNAEKAEGEFFFTDNRGNILGMEEAREQFNEYRTSSRKRSEKEVKLHIRIKPEEEGWAYLQASEIIPLGYADGKKYFESEITYPISDTQLSDYYNYLILNKENYDAFIAKLKENGMNEVSVFKDSISGRTDYVKEGYTMISLADNGGYRAYLNGKEVPVEDILGNVIFISTPAGSHEIKLELMTGGLSPANLFSIIALIADILILVFIYGKSYRKNNVQE